MSGVVAVAGYGLGFVLERGEHEGRPFVRVSGHGPPSPGPHRTVGQWFWADQVRDLTQEEAREALETERADAGARGVACNTPNCWCITFLRRSA